MTCGIYLLQSTLDGKRYVGRAENIERRIDQHRTRCIRIMGCGRLQTHVERYGWTFEVKIVLICEKADLHYYEGEVIQKLQPELNSYQCGTYQTVEVNHYAKPKARKFKPEPKPRKPPQPGKYDGLVLVSPEGEEFRNLVTVEYFAMMHRIIHLSSMLKGECASSNGWTHYWE